MCGGCCSKSRKLKAEDGGSFNGRAFENIRNTVNNLTDTTKHQWNKILANKKLENFNILNNRIVPAMDSVFFHPDRFEIIIDARGFYAADIKCALYNSGYVEVRAQRKETIDSTTKKMDISRNYSFPNRFNSKLGVCALSSEGVLLITAPWG